MSLADTLAKFESSHGEDDENKINVFDKLKNKEIIRARRKNPQLIIRILPSNTEDGTFYKEFRSWIVPVTNSKGVTKQSAITLEKDKNPDDPMQQHIDKLTQNDTLPVGSYGPITPSTSFYVNAFVYTLDKNTGALNYMQGQDSPVYVVQLGISQMRAIMEKLGNPMFNPNSTPRTVSDLGREATPEEKDLSFISTALAYPIMITLGGDNKYSVDIMTNYVQAPLPQGWESWAEDLDYLAQPLYKTNPSYMEYVINQQRSLEAGKQSQPQPQQMPQQGFNNGQLQNTALGYAQQPQYQQQATAPQAPQQTAYQPPVAPQAPQQSSSMQMPQMPTQANTEPQAPVQPNEPQAPVHAEVPDINPVTPSIPTAPTAPAQTTSEQSSSSSSNPLADYGTPLSSTPEPASKPATQPTREQQISDTSDAVAQALAKAGINNMDSILGK